MKLDILYEDNHLLVVCKPAGLLTQPSGTEQMSLEVYAKDWIKHKYQKPGKAFLEALHRLDKPVSGIVLFARTSKALSRLNIFLREKQSHKLYLAVVEGNLPFEEGSLEHYLLHDEYHARIVNKEFPDAKLARLKYRKISSSGPLSLLEIDLETGRYHQIRAQLSFMGCPIVGDVKYGSSVKLQEGIIALHHHRLIIPHPISHVLMTFEAPLPAYWPIT